MCNLPGIEAADLNPAITVLQLLLSSPKPALRSVHSVIDDKVLLSVLSSVVICLCVLLGSLP